MSFSKACFGCNPSTTASPPQNGSTYRRSAFASQIGFRCETSQRLPPAHFSGGFNCRGGPPWPPPPNDIRFIESVICHQKGGVATEGHPYNLFHKFAPH